MFVFLLTNQILLVSRSGVELKIFVYYKIRVELKTLLIISWQCMQVSEGGGTFESETPLSVSVEICKVGGRRHD